MADIQMVVGVDYSELTGLVKTGEQTKRVLSSAAKEFSRTGNQKQYMHAVNKIVLAQKQLDVSSRMTRSEIMKLGAKMQQEVKFTDALTASTKRLTVAQGISAKVMQQTKNRMNGNNMAIQQLGYQFGDFAVQVQGGTSAFVAFSQQGAQLAGILPMIAGPLGLSMGAAVGLSAALGILIPVGSAVARMFFEMKGTADEAKSAVDRLKSSLEAVEKITFDSTTKGIGAFEQKWKSILELQREYLRGEIKLSRSELFDEMGLSEATTALEKQLAPIELGFKAQPQMREIFAESQDPGAVAYREQLAELSKLKAIKNELNNLDLTNSQTMADSFRLALDRLNVEHDLTEGEEKKLRLFADQAGILQTISEEGKSLSNSQKSSAVDLQKNLEVLRKRSNEWTRSASAGYKVFQKTAAEQRKADEAVEKAILKANQAVEEQIRLQDQAKELQAIELEVGKKHAKYTQQAAKFERENLALKMRQAGVDEDLITSMLAGNIHLEVGLELLKKQTAELALQAGYTSRIFEGSAAGIALSKYGARGTNLPPPKDPTETTTPTGPKVVDPYANLQKQLELEEALIGKTEARKRVINALGVDQSKWGPEAVTKLENEVIAVQKLQAAEEERIRVIEEAKRQQEDLADTIERSMGDAFMAMSDGTKSVSDAFRTMAAEIVRELYKVYVMQVAIAAIKTWAGGFFEDGGTFSGGKEVKAYANGGIVGGPTTFPMAGGKTGLMGEAGPEAIMPLKRGANGKLGVQAEGGSGDIYVTNNYSISANTSEDTKRLVTQTIQQAQPALTQAAKASIMNDRRRGGQMKSVFG